jgi:hypothetical protein
MDEDRVIQDWNDSWPWNQNWQIVVDDSEIPTSVKNVKLVQKQPSVIHRYGTQMQLILGSTHKNQESLVRIVNLEGRQMFVEKAQKNLQFDISTFPKGVYQIIIGEGSSSETLRILKR